MIDREKLERVIAEIERCIDRCNDKMKSCPVNTQVEAICFNKIGAYKKILSFIDSLEEEPVSNDSVKCTSKIILEGTNFNKSWYAHPELAFKAGAKWQKENLWKPADGDDLPEYEREVVAFQETFPTDVDVPSLLKIVIAHRPNPEGYDGKSLTTGEVEHYTPKTYDKGGWNIPDVKWWLDCLLPKEIEI